MHQSRSVHWVSISYLRARTRKGTLEATSQRLLTKRPWLLLGSSVAAVVVLVQLCQPIGKNVHLFILIQEITQVPYGSKLLGAWCIVSTQKKWINQTLIVVVIVLVFKRNTKSHKLFSSRGCMNGYKTSTVNCYLSYARSCRKITSFIKCLGAVRYMVWSLHGLHGLNFALVIAFFLF